MSEDAEKRLRSVMEKLFSSLQSKPNSPSSSDVQLAKGKKRPNPMSASAIELKLKKDIQQSTAPVQAPLCRPWDREDLMKRLATFKSMTWFAKPKAISAVNCARRGWVNVDMDIIACESCGARLLFSTPSSWTQQQVEKAALVFSLKLDNGHKLLCPWMDNACDETLAQFPPATVQGLVDGYKERSSALLQLVALPFISSAAISYMRSPQLEHFLRQSPVLEHGNVSTVTSQTEYIGNECDAVSANLYFQAQKIISLCGWKPRLLPYVVESKDRQCKSAKDVNHLNQPDIVANMQTPPISILSSAPDESLQANDNPMASSQLQCEHSVVLECSLCGATVGLWAFSTVPRPTECFRLVGNSEVTGESIAFHSEGSVSCPVNGAPGIHDSGKENNVNNTEAFMITGSKGARSSNKGLLNLHLTIAGGPPPTEQNFRATISIPVIGQNLRARFSSDYGFRDHACLNQENSPSDTQGKCLFLEGKSDTENTLTAQIVQKESTDLPEGKRQDDGQFNGTVTDQATSNDQSPSLNCNISEKDDALRNGSNRMSLERPNVNQEELNLSETGTHDSSFKGQSDNIQDIVQSSGQNNELAESGKVGTVIVTSTEHADDVGAANPPVTEGADNVARDSCITSTDANRTARNAEHGEDDSRIVVGVDGCNLQQIHRHLRGDKHSDVQNILNPQPNCQGDNSVKDGGTIPVNNEVVACGSANDMKQQPVDKAMEFDPIWQHRHFCPWISADGSAAPGWQRTLSALQYQKDFADTSPSDSRSLSIIKVDDPIASVRRLFMSSSAKRMKLTDGST